jgi:hypothetical protein
MEALSGVAVGCGDDARSWRKDRTEGYTSPLGWETGFSGASASGPGSASPASASASGREQARFYSRNISQEAVTRAKMQQKALEAERLAQLTNGLTDQVPITQFLPVGKGPGTSVFTAEEQANQFPGLFSGGKKHKKHGSRSRSRSRCNKGKVFDRDTKRCRNPKSKSKSKSRSRSRRMGGGGKKCNY